MLEVRCGRYLYTLGFFLNNSLFSTNFLHVDIVMLHVDILILHVKIIILHVEIFDGKITFTQGTEVCHHKSVVDVREIILLRTNKKDS